MPTPRQRSLQPNDTQPPTLHLQLEGSSLPSPSPPARAASAHLWEPGAAFCTAELKKASLKKSREPLKTTRALFLAWSPAMSSVFFPTACGYWERQTAVSPESPGEGRARGQQAGRQPEGSTAGPTASAPSCSPQPPLHQPPQRVPSPFLCPRAQDLEASRLRRPLTWVIGLSGKKE